MKLTRWFPLLFIGFAVAAGCSGGGGPTAQDSSFEKGLASAAATNKNGERPRTAFKRSVPSEALKSKAAGDASSAPAASGPAPAATGN